MKNFEINYSGVLLNVVAKEKRRAKTKKEATRRAGLPIGYDFPVSNIQKLGCRKRH
jgi:hypothetical protein